MRYIISIIVVLVMLPSLVVGANLQYMESTAELGEKANHRLTFIFSEVPDKLTYPVFYEISDFESSANFRNYSCGSEEMDWGSEITCDLSGKQGSGNTLRLKFTSENLKNLEGFKRYEENIKVPAPADKLVVRTRLKEGYVLMKEEEGVTSLVPFSPSNGTKGSDGREIWITWVKKNLNKGDGLAVSIIYESLKPAPKNNGTVYFLVAGVLVLLILLAVVMKSYSSRRGSLSVLKDDERKVIETLESYGKECKQREIVRETGFSKTKVSRLIKNLEERDMVEVERTGRTKVVRIKEEE